MVGVKVIMKPIHLPLSPSCEKVPHGSSVPSVPSLEGRLCDLRLEEMRFGSLDELRKELRCRYIEVSGFEFVCEWRGTLGDSVYGDRLKTSLPVEDWGRFRCLYVLGTSHESIPLWSSVLVRNDDGDGKTRDPEKVLVLPYITEVWDSDISPTIEPWIPPPKEELEKFVRLDNFLSKREPEMRGMVGDDVHAMIPRWDSTTKSMYLVVVVHNLACRPVGKVTPKRLEAWLNDESELPVRVVYEEGTTQTCGLLDQWKNRPWTHGARYRPLRMGSSISSVGYKLSGTLGAIVQDLSGDRRHALTCLHCVSGHMMNGTNEEIIIEQPSMSVLSACWSRKVSLEKKIFANVLESYPSSMGVQLLELIQSQEFSRFARLVEENWEDLPKEYSTHEAFQGLRDFIFEAKVLPREIILDILESHENEVGNTLRTLIRGRKYRDFLAKLEKNWNVVAAQYSEHPKFFHLKPFCTSRLSKSISTGIRADSFLDACVCRIADDRLIDPSACCVDPVAFRGSTQDPKDLKFNAPVMKSGARTGLTKGTIVRTRESFILMNDDIEIITDPATGSPSTSTILESNQRRLDGLVLIAADVEDTDIFGLKGDSGSIILTDDDNDSENRAVAMLTAVVECRRKDPTGMRPVVSLFTIGVPIGRVLSALKCKFPEARG